MFDKILKQLCYVNSIMNAETSEDKAIIGFKLITNSSVEEAYDIFWLLNESIHGEPDIFSAKMGKLIKNCIDGKIHKFKVQNLCTAIPNERLASAVRYAQGGHLGQSRKGLLSRPYMHHILMVWYLVALSGGNTNQQIAALLHDYLEDVPDKAISITFAKKSIASQFGKIVLRYCLSLKNKTGLSGKTPELLKEKHEWQLNHLANLTTKVQLIKLCDRIANLYDTRRDGPAINTPKQVFTEIVKAREFFNVCKKIPPFVNCFFDYIDGLIFKKYDLKHLNI